MEHTFKIGDRVRISNEKIAQSTWADVKEGQTGTCIVDQKGGYVHNVEMDGQTGQGWSIPVGGLELIPPVPANRKPKTALEAVEMSIQLWGRLPTSFYQKESICQELFGSGFPWGCPLCAFVGHCHGDGNEACDNCPYKIHFGWECWADSSPYQKWWGNPCEAHAIAFKRELEAIRSVLIDKKEEEERPESKFKAGDRIRLKSNVDSGIGADFGRGFTIGTSPIRWSDSHWTYETELEPYHWSISEEWIDCKEEKWVDVTQACSLSFLSHFSSKGYVIKVTYGGEIICYLTPSGCCPRDGSTLSELPAGYKIEEDYPWTRGAKTFAWFRILHKETK